MRFLELLIAFLTGQGKAMFQENAQHVTERVANNARRIAILLAVAIIFITLFCSGFTMGYTAFFESLHNNEIWYGPKFLGGLALALISVGGLIYSLGEQRWLDALGTTKEVPHHEQVKPQSSPLEGAIALIIVELLNEFKKRNQAKAETPAAPETAAAAE